ncbi:MAG TPA: c-type cytochrome [Chitinophagaceae bacterium]|nr:c-type cytochrome [Chitinophagaceae bacterium]
MKKTIFIIAMLGLLAACGGGEKKDEKTSATTESKAEGTTDELSSNPIYQKAMELIGNSDCRTCHLIEEKNIGPAWRDVAKKYADSANAVEYLSHKIINGGAGVWGQVPMAPHLTMPQEDAETLAKFVLLLKNK